LRHRDIPPILRRPLSTVNESCRRPQIRRSE
jgi:hypothetical protein